MLAVIDNYDSFTYNLVQYLQQLGAEVRVWRNDEITAAQLRALAPDKIVISPGPGRPADAGVSGDVVRELGPDIPVLGVCLGHQAIGEVMGAKVVRAPRIMHGKTSEVRHDGEGLFAGVENPFVATRYHSLALDPSSMPDCLEVTAWADDGEEEQVIMAMRHKRLPLLGVQFHPESILTVQGMRLLQNFMEKY